MEVNLFQLIQWKHWLTMEIRTGKHLPHSEGSVRACAAKRFNLNPREKRETVLAYVETAIDALKDIGSGTLDWVEISFED